MDDCAHNKHNSEDQHLDLLESAREAQRRHKDVEQRPSEVGLHEAEPLEQDRYREQGDDQYDSEKSIWSASTTVCKT